MSQFKDTADVFIAASFSFELCRMAALELVIREHLAEMCFFELTPWLSDGKHLSPSVFSKSGAHFMLERVLAIAICTHTRGRTQTYE